MAVADNTTSLVLSGTGDVLEPEDGLIGIARRLLRARRRPASLTGTYGRRGHRAEGHGDRRRYLHLHEPLGDV